MGKFPQNLARKLQQREKNNSLRTLGRSSDLIDFSSNDYLGFSRSTAIFKKTSEVLRSSRIEQNGATGSRLLSGNSGFYEATENQIAQFHQVESALIFNSGYDANIGFFSSVPQRGDLVFYDEFIHASIRDGIKMGLAKSYKFKHNDLSSLRLPSIREKHSGEIYIVTEAVFSMDGDSPDLNAFVDFCSENHCRLIVDEAHAVGVFGKNGTGLVQELGMQDQVFARIVTFGKALGGHGAAILGSKTLSRYLLNFARSFIYTTALPPHSVASIQTAYSALQTSTKKKQLQINIAFFRAEVKNHHLENNFISSNSAIQTCLVPGNEQVKSAAQFLQAAGFDVKPILSPTVPAGKERLRFCLHSFNSEEEISGVLNALTQLFDPYKK